MKTIHVGQSQSILPIGTPKGIRFVTQGEGSGRGLLPKEPRSTRSTFRDDLNNDPTLKTNVISNRSLLGQYWAVFRFAAKSD